MFAAPAPSSTTRPIFHQGSGDVGLRTIINVSLIALSILTASLCFAYGSSFLSMYSGVTLILGAAATIPWTIHKTSSKATHTWQEAAYSVALSLGAPIAFPAAIASVVSQGVSAELLKNTFAEVVQVTR